MGVEECQVASVSLLAVEILVGVRPAGGCELVAALAVIGAEEGGVVLGWSACSKASKWIMEQLRLGRTGDLVI